MLRRKEDRQFRTSDMHYYSRSVSQFWTLMNWNWTLATVCRVYRWSVISVPLEEHRKEIQQMVILFSEIEPLTAAFQFQRCTDFGEWPNLLLGQSYWDQTGSLNQTEVPSHLFSGKQGSNMTGESSTPRHGHVHGPPRELVMSRSRPRQSAPSSGGMVAASMSR